MISPDWVIGDKALKAVDFVDTPVPPFEIGKKPEVPVAKGKLFPFIKLINDGSPKYGETSVGEFENTKFPEPVSLEITSASSAELVTARAFNLFVV
jgi:hypothetical protein